MARSFMICPFCGGDIEGDGFTEVFRCENAPEEAYEFCEPDAKIRYCGLDCEVPSPEETKL